MEYVFIPFAAVIFLLMIAVPVAIILSFFGDGVTRVNAWRKGHPPPPVSDPLDSERTTREQANWRAEVADIEFRREQEQRERQAEVTRLKLIQEGWRPPMQAAPAPDRRLRKELLFGGPFHGKSTMVAPADRRLNLPAHAPLIEQHRYERNDSGKFVWRGRANGSYPQVRVIIRSSEDLCYGCSDNPRKNEPGRTTALYCEQGAHSCSKCDKRATREIDIANFTKNVLICNEHLSEVHF